MYDGLQEEIEGLTNWLPRFRGECGEDFKHTPTLKPLNLNIPLRKPKEKGSVVIKDTSGKTAQPLSFQNVPTGHEMKSKFLYYAQ